MRASQEARGRRSCGALRRIAVPEMGIGIAGFLVSAVVWRLCSEHNGPEVLPMSVLVLYTFLLALSLFGVAGLLVGYLLWMNAHERSYADPRTVICPENLDYVTVTVDAEYAAKTALAGREKIRIASCSRWPDRQECDQACAGQVPLAGDDRRNGQYAPFGLTPGQLRSETPVRITRQQYDAVMAQKTNPDLSKRPA